MSNRTQIQLKERLDDEDRDKFLACGGGILSSYQGKDTLTLWLPDDDENEYVLSDMALITFYRWCKDDMLDRLYATRDLIAYIKESAKQPPSAFVRDAIIAKAVELEGKLNLG
jgi:hypothetical protein